MGEGQRIDMGGKRGSCRLSRRSDGRENKKDGGDNRRRTLSGRKLEWEKIRVATEGKGLYRKKPLQEEGRRRFITRELFHREGIVVPWKIVEHLSYNIVCGEIFDCVCMWLWHKRKNLRSVPIETCNTDHRQTVWNMTGFMGELR